MNHVACVAGLFAFAALAAPAPAFTYTLTPVTITSPNFAGPILINGNIVLAPGEIFISPNLMSTVNLPFKAGFTAGFNGNGQTFDPGFLAWNGLGSYSGPIYNHQISPNNLGYAAGMPLGLYGSNPLGPGGQSSIILSYSDALGLTRSATSTYAISVVIPAPSTALLLALPALLARRRR